MFNLPNINKCVWDIDFFQAKWLLQDFEIWFTHRVSKRILGFLGPTNYQFVWMATTLGY
jgi:hypothetical protein